MRVYQPGSHLMRGARRDRVERLVVAADASAASRRSAR